MTFADYLSRLSRRLFTAERYAVEIFLTLASLWAAKVLWLPPLNFPTFRGVLWIATMESDEQFWAVMLFIGGMAKLIGLICCCKPPARGIGLTLRILGLGLSGFFWTAMGGSALRANPDVLMGVPMMLMGISAWWTLLRFPALPRAS